MRKQTMSSFDQIMVCICLVPLSETMLIYCEFHQWKQRLVKFESNTTTSKQENESENVVCKMAAIRVSALTR